MRYGTQQPGDEPGLDLLCHGLACEAGIHHQEALGFILGTLKIAPADTFEKFPLLLLEAIDAALRIIAKVRACSTDLHGRIEQYRKVRP